MGSEGEGGGEERGGGGKYFVKPRPSMRTTIKVLGMRLSDCSKERTYSYLADCQSYDSSYSVGDLRVDASDPTSRATNSGCAYC